jgi:hypothetical protein
VRAASILETLLWVSLQALAGAKQRRNWNRHAVIGLHLVFALLMLDDSLRFE